LFLISQEFSHAKPSLTEKKEKDSSIYAMRTDGRRQGKPWTVEFDPLKMTAEILLRLTLAIGQ